MRGSFCGENISDRRGLLQLRRAGGSNIASADVLLHLLLSHVCFFSIPGGRMPNPPWAGFYEMFVKKIPKTFYVSAFCLLFPVEGCGILLCGLLRDCGHALRPLTYSYYCD